MELIPQGIAKGLIALSEDGKTITYLSQNKKRNYTNPEEQVQAETFLKLVLIQLKEYASLSPYKWALVKKQRILFIMIMCVYRFILLSNVKIRK